MNPAEVIAEALKRELEPLLAKGLRITGGENIDGDSWEIRIIFDPVPGGPFLGISLKSPDLTSPIKRLALKPYRLLQNVPLKAQKGTTQAIVEYVIQWFRAHLEDLTKASNDYPKTLPELRELLQKELGKISGLKPEIWAGVGAMIGVNVGGMRFTIGPSAHTRWTDTGLPDIMKLSGEGPGKFRTVNAPPWVLVEHLSKWIRAHMPALKQASMLDRIVCGAISFRPSDLRKENRDIILVLLRKNVRDLEQLSSRWDAQNPTPAAQKVQISLDAAKALLEAFEHDISFGDLPVAGLNQSQRSNLGRREYFINTDEMDPLSRLPRSKTIFYVKKMWPENADPRDLREDMAMKQFVDAVYTPNAPHR